jgi:hypothetical protein
MTDTTDTPIVPELAEDNARRDLEVQNTSAAIDQAVMDSYDVLKAVGRIEGIEFTRRVGEVAIAQIFSEARNSKKYKGLPYKDRDGVTRRVGTFEEFCQEFLGKSYNRCLELAQNLHLLGSDLYESAERIGFRAKDYRALKALPPEEQEVVRQALASESKDEVLSILEDMAARNQAEREAAKRERENMSADLEARDKLVESKAKALDKAQIELEKLKSLPPAENQRLRLEREAAAAERLDKGEVKAEAAVNEWLAEVADVIEAEGVSEHTRTYAANMIRYFAERFTDYLANYGIVVDFEGIVRPEWTRSGCTDGDAQ